MLSPGFYVKVGHDALLGIVPLMKSFGSSIVYYDGTACYCVNGLNGSYSVSKWKSVPPKIHYEYCKTLKEVIDLFVAPHINTPKEQIVRNMAFSRLYSLFCHLSMERNKEKE